MLNSLDNDRHQIQCLCLSCSSLSQEKREKKRDGGEAKQKNEAPLSKLKLEF
jgi:hypothetical protein